MLPKNDFNRKMNDFDNFTKTSQTSQNFPQNVGNLGKIIVAKGFEKLPKVQQIATSGHTTLDFIFSCKVRRQLNRSCII